MWRSLTGSSAALLFGCCVDCLHAFSPQAVECASRSLLQTISSPSPPSVPSEHALHSHFSALQASARDRGIAVDLGQSMGDALIGLSRGEQGAEDLDATRRASGDASVNLRMQLDLPISPEEIHKSDLGPLPKFLKGLNAALRAAVHDGLVHSVHGTQTRSDQLVFRSIRGSYLELNTSDDGSVNTSDTPAGNITLLRDGVLLENRITASETMDNFDFYSKPSRPSENTTLFLEVSRLDALKDSEPCTVYSTLLQELNDRQSSLMIGPYGGLLQGSTLVTSNDRCGERASAADQQSTIQVVAFAILRIFVICMLGVIAFRSTNPQQIPQVA